MDLWFEAPVALVSTAPIYMDERENQTKLSLTVTMLNSGILQPSAYDCCTIQDFIELELEELYVLRQDLRCLQNGIISTTDILILTKSRK